MPAFLTEPLLCHPSKVCHQRRLWCGRRYGTIQMSIQAILEEKVQPGEATGDSGVGGVTSGQAGKK